MTSRRTIFMFSGQGSQYFQMGRALYDGNAIFRDWMERLDEIARSLSGRSIVQVLYGGQQAKGSVFDRTLFTHPAVFMVEYALAQVLIQADVIPDMVLGVSLGAFAAAAIAGFLDVEDALGAVIRQAAAIEQHADAGGMTAVLADPATFASDFLSSRSELAAVNFCSHFVVSAKMGELDQIECELKNRRVSYQRLPVSAPFHSRWIDEARAPFTSFMQSVPSRAGKLPMACCERKLILGALPGDYFWNVIRRPICFQETIATLEQQGPGHYIDCGPAGTLATFLRYGVLRDSPFRTHAVLSPYGFDRRNLTELLASSQSRHPERPNACLHRAP